MDLANELRAEASHKRNARTGSRTWEPERYQRQRLEEGSDQINMLMGQLRQRETSEGATAVRQNTEEDRMDVDEPEQEASGPAIEQEQLTPVEQEVLRRRQEEEKRQKEELKRRQEESLRQEESRRQRAEQQTGLRPDAALSELTKARQRHARKIAKEAPKRRQAPPVQIQDENMFVRDDWWKEWSPEELMTMVAYYKNDIQLALQGRHSGLNHAELTALRLGEMKRLVRRDAKKMLLTHYNSLLDKMHEAQVKEERFKQQQRERNGEHQAETTSGSGVKQEPSSSNRNLHTGMPRSSQGDKNMESTASDEETEDVIANTTTMSLLEPQNIELTEEQQTIFDLVTQQGQSLFFTGGAGTGKSVLIKEIRRYCDATGIICKVTAPTGLAAVNIDGITLFRWAGLGIMKEGPGSCIEKLRSVPQKAALWKFTDILIIDETSMVSGAMFDKIDQIAREVRSNFLPIAEKAEVQAEWDMRKRKKPRNFAFLKQMLEYNEEDAKRDRALKHLPFGGMQIVCVGDFYQLPPVPSFEEKNAWTKTHSANTQPPPDFLFSSEAFQQVFGPNRLRLTVAKRQAEGSVFSKMLNLFRKYSGTTDETVALRNYFSQFIGQHPSGQETVHLQSTISGVEATNQRELKSLDGPEVYYYAADTRNLKEYTEDFVERAMKEINADETLCLKPGAQVIFLKNDYEQNLVNGHMGQVAFLMTQNLYNLYEADLKVLFKLYHYIKSRNLRSLSQNPKIPAGMEEYLGVDALTHQKWCYYRYALMHIDEEYRQEALAQKKKTRRENTNLLVVFRLADEYMEDEGRTQQFFLVPSADFEKLDYSRILTEEERANQNKKYPTICTRVQLPLSLSWALTIHKAQGQTLIRTVVDMKGMFAEGQAYVAMSRVRSPEDLKLTCFELPKLTCPEVSRFDDTIRDALTVKKEGANGFSGFFNPPSSSTPAGRSSPPASSYESAASAFDSSDAGSPPTGHYTSQR